MNGNVFINDNYDGNDNNDQDKYVLLKADSTFVSTSLQLVLCKVTKGQTCFFLDLDL